MLKSTMNRGFSLTFENGLTISVQFGTGNYCERRDYSSGYDGDLKSHIVEANNAEIAIWDESNQWFDFGSDKVKGWVNADEVAIWIDKVRRAKNIHTIKRIK